MVQSQTLSLKRFYNNSKKFPIYYDYFLAAAIIKTVMGLCIAGSYDYSSDEVFSLFIIFMNIFAIFFILVTCVEYVWTKEHFHGNNNVGAYGSFMSINSVFVFGIPIIELIYMHKRLSSLTDGSSVNSYFIIADGAMINIILILNIYRNIYNKYVVLESHEIVQNPVTISEVQRTEILDNLKSDDPDITGYPCGICFEIYNEVSLTKSCTNDECDNTHNMCSNCFYKFKAMYKTTCPFCRQDLLDRPVLRFSKNQIRESTIV